jgi:hypothetical protein
MIELLIAIGLIAGVIAAHEIGFRLGSLIRSVDQPFDRQVGLVRTSTAALVAFLIGFAFSGAASRFIDRQDIIVKEANALGTAYLRADTVAEPQRGDPYRGNLGCNELSFVACRKQATNAYRTTHIAAAPLTPTGADGLCGAQTVQVSGAPDGGSSPGAIFLRPRAIGQGVEGRGRRSWCLRRQTTATRGDFRG